MAVTYSSLSTNSKNVYNRLGCWAITKVGIALQERKTTSATQLYRDSGREFPELLDKCDVVLLCQEYFRADVPVAEDIVAIKNLLKAFYGSGTGGEKVWRKWTDYKHIYRNYYRPHFKMGSGENEDDAILKAAKHHWAFKKNKNIKVYNNKCLKDGKPEQQKTLVTNDDAPDNLNQSAEIYPEAIVFLLFHDHPIFQPESSSSMTSTNYLSSPTDTQTSDTPTEQGGLDDGEEKTLRNRMTTKGFFKSRNAQRAEEFQRMNKNKKNKVSVNQSEIIDLTKEKTAIAKEHVQAARSQVEMMKVQCKLSVIDHAIKVGINVDRLRPCVEKTLQELFPDVINMPVENGIEYDDVEILEEIDDSSEATQGRTNVYGSAYNRDMNNRSISGTVVNDGSKSHRGRCCAGSECVQPDEFIDDEFLCRECKGMAHALCIVILGVGGDICFSCVLENSERFAEK